MSQSSSQQLEVAADWDHSEAAWRATHSPVVVRKPATSELPTERLNVVDSSLDWQRAMPDSMAAPMLPRNLPFAEVVLSLLLPLVRAIFKCFESSNFRDHDLANVLIGETLWRTQSAMRSVPMEQAWCGCFESNRLCCAFLFADSIGVGFVVAAPF
jgi:hypothetical protein